MADQTLGRAVYELGTDDTKLVQGIDSAEAKLLASGQKVEQSVGDISDAYKKAGDVAGRAFDDVNIDPDIDPAVRDLKKVEGEFDDVGDKAKENSRTAERALDGVGDKAKETGDKLHGMSVVGIGAVAGIAGALASKGLDMALDAAHEAIGKVSEAIQLSSDKAENASKAQVIFGDSYRLIEDKANHAADTVAMSSGKYLEAAGNVGNLVTNLGYAGDEAANMSGDLVQLAADMGSFNNADTASVVEAIGAAFRGETEPIRAYGVMLSQTAVQQKAVAMGLVDSVGAFNKLDFATRTHIQTEATYQLILDQTKNAQGDLARTATGYANAQRLAAARQEEAWTRLGDAIKPLANEILPALMDVGTGVVNAVVDIVSSVKKWTEDNRELLDSLQKIIGGGLGWLKDNIGPVIVPAVLALATAFAINLATDVASTALALTGKLIPALASTRTELETTGAAGTGAGLALKAGVLVAVAALADEIAPKANQAGNDIGRAVFGGIAGAFGNTEETGILHGTIADSLTDGVHSAIDGVVGPDTWLARFNVWDHEHGLFYLKPETADVIGGQVSQAVLDGVLTHSREEHTDEAATTFAESMTQSWQSRAADYEAIGASAAEKIDDGIVHYDPTKAAQQFSESIQESINSEADRFQALGATIPSKIATGIIDAGQDVLDAGDRLIELLKNGLTPAEEAARLEGKKYTKAVAEGVRSEIPGAKEAAQEMAIQAIKTIEDASNGTPNTKGLKAIGAYYDDLMASGMTAQQAAVALKAGGVAEAVIVKLTGYKGDVTDIGTEYDAALAQGVKRNTDALDGPLSTIRSKFDLDTHTWGYKVGDAWIGGFSQAVRGGAGTIANAIDKATRATHGESPPKEGPLRFIDKWGENVAGAWIGGFAGKLAGAGDLVSSALSGMGAAVLGTPSLGGYGAPALAAAPSSSIALNGGIHVTVQGGNGTPAEIGGAVETAVLRVLDQVARAQQSLPLDRSGRPI